MGRPPECPHCHTPTLLWQSPEASSWGGSILHVCFNDLCPYYVEGWEWMRKQYQVPCSYRYSRDPETGRSGPLPVWSPEALKDAVISPPNTEASNA